jgi:hypothetical protein
MIVNVVERAQVEVTIVATDRNCTSGRVPRRTEQRAVSERVLSDIFAFPRKSFTYFHFTDRSSWLALALGTPFCRVSGTIVGTVLSSRSVADWLRSSRHRGAALFTRTVYVIDGGTVPTV